MLPYRESGPEPGSEPGAAVRDLRSLSWWEQFYKASSLLLLIGMLTFLGLFVGFYVAWDSTRHESECSAKILGNLVFEDNYDPERHYFKLGQDQLLLYNYNLGDKYNLCKEKGFCCHEYMKKTFPPADQVKSIAAIPAGRKQGCLFCGSSPSSPSSPSGPASPSSQVQEKTVGAALQDATCKSKCKHNAHCKHGWCQKTGWDGRGPEKYCKECPSGYEICGKSGEDCPSKGGKCCTCVLESINTC